MPVFVAVMHGTVRTSRFPLNPVGGPIVGGDSPTSEVGHADLVGFNPFRQQRRSTADYVMVAAALVVCALLVAWALFG